VRPFSADLYIHRNNWETAYPTSLIRLILEAKGPSYLCDEIAREEDPLYVPLNLELSLFSYIEEGFFGTGTRLLDFGCGTGASGVFLGRSFPEAEIVGVELIAESLEIAEARREFYGLDNLRFEVSPSGESLPENLGLFDGILMSAVFEHLLPQERKILMPVLWDALKPGGILFINETPNRFFPIELHTSGLPMLNYLPKSVAMAYARRFSSRVDVDASWDLMLREGIRGGSVGEILACLPDVPGVEPKLIPVHRHGRKDDIDLWHDASVRKTGDSRKKRTFKLFAKTARKLSGFTFAPEIVMAVRKSQI
jgi:2-polyprenyl-3-methyl-5-hydroxy-6-metoxy-1,4-benzoquinol methylase